MMEAQESLHFLDYWRVIRTRKEIVIAIALLVIATGVLVTFQMPRVYMSSVLISVKDTEETPDVPVFGSDARRWNPYFLRTQFEIIQSLPVLEGVVRKLNLHDSFSRLFGYADLPPDRRFDRTVKLLSGMMKVQQFRETNLIEIQIYLSEPKDTAPQEAAVIANEVAEVYRSDSLRRSQETTRRALEAIRESLAEREKQLREAEGRVADIREKHRIDLAGPTDGTPGTLDRIRITEMEGRLVDLRLEEEAKRVKLETVLTLPATNLLDAAPYLVGDQALNALRAEKRRTEVELKDKATSLGEKHPDIVRLRNTIGELDAKLADALNGLKTGVQADYEAARAKRQALEREINTRQAEIRGARAEHYREYQRALADFESLKKIRDALEIRHEQVKIEMQIPKTMVEVIARAKPSALSEFVSPNFALNILLSVLVGLGAGLVLAYFLEYLDTSVKTIEEVERVMGLPVLGVIPQKVRPFAGDRVDSAHAEAYRVLRTNIQFSKRFKDCRSLCVTSGSMGEGKSLTLFNLAYISAQLGDRVLIVDSDLHRPRQHKMLGVSNALGIANILVGETSLEDCVVSFPNIPNLHLLPSGKLSSGVHGLLGTLRMKELAAALRERYEMIYFDAPPMIGVSDASLLVREVDAVLLVVQHRKYPRAVSVRAKDMVENLGGNLIGVVLNNINISRDHSYYYYHQHYYSYPKGTSSARKAAAAGG